jgi:hypothetical protein
MTAIGALVSVASVAADLPTQKAAPAPVPVPAIPSTWRVELTGYGWATTLVGQAGVARFPTTPFYVNFGEILDHFEGAFMGAAVVRNDTFIFGLDFIWARVGTGVTFKEPGSPLFGVGADLKLSSIVTTAVGGMRIPVGPPNLSLYGIVGARYFHDGTSITLTGPAFGFSHNTSVAKDWVDPIVGFYGHYRIDDKWFVNSEADIGALSNSATGQALAAVGYNWTQNVATTFGYRVLYTYDKQDTGDRSFRLVQWMHGPYAALKYTF